MMKRKNMIRIFAAVLTLALSLSCFTFAARAYENTVETQPSAEVITDAGITERFEQWASDNYRAALCKDSSYMGGEIGYYEPEVRCRHTDSEGALDWALIRVCSFPELDWEIAMRFGDLIIESGGEEAIFPFGYGIYDAADDTFYDLYADRDRLETYPDLKAVLEELQIGRPIGDADADGTLTVLDATKVQRMLADLDVYEYNGALYYLHEPGQPILDGAYFADYDLDSEVTVLDATGIQRNLVGLT